MTTPASVHLPGTELHSLHSNSVDYDFEISVQLPPPKVEGPLPVIYVTDANMGFGMSTAIAGLLGSGAEIPPWVLRLELGASPYGIRRDDVCPVDTQREGSTRASGPIEKPIF